MGKKFICSTLVSLTVLLTNINAGSVLSGTSNTATGNKAVVSGGYKNHASGYMSTISGGREGSTIGDYATVSGGYLNNTDGYMALIAGGRENLVLGSYAAILGGYKNSVDGTSSTIIGGSNNKIYTLNPSFKPSFSIIGGGKENNIVGLAVNAIIGGGSNNTIDEASHSIISAGAFNTIQRESGYAVLAGGGYNSINGTNNTISGGSENNNSARSGSVIGGGTNNKIESGISNIITGGRENIIKTGENSVIVGGHYNILNGFNSLVAGNSVTVDADSAVGIGENILVSHLGSWVIGDSTGTTTNKPERASEIENRFHAYFENGYKLYTTSDNSSNSGVYLNAGDSAWNSLSDKNSKENYKKVNKQEILNKLVAMPIEEWNYISQDDKIRHIGPYAQDFNRAYHLGDGKLTISTIDADGIALVSLQALAERNKNLEAKVEALEARLKRLELFLK